MASRRSPGKRIFKAFLPILLLVLLGVGGAVGWIVHGVTHPLSRAYVVTPEQFSQLSDRGLKATNEMWTNRDGTTARGWLLRGGEGKPAVVLLHRYGADRSWLLNLGVKLNEATNYTVLWPDLRGHGANPLVPWTSLGPREAEDTLAALDYLRNLKTEQQRPLVGDALGLYGVEMGAFAALKAAHNQSVRALVLDSVPASTQDILRAAVKTRVGLDNGLVQLLTRGGMRLYFRDGYQPATSCASVPTSASLRVLLLAGSDAPQLRDSTIALARCFPNPNNVELKTDLPLTGFNLPFSTGVQGEAYDRLVIDFFDRTLSAAP